MHRNTNGSRLISNRPRDGLANPPGRIGREFIASAILKFVDRLHQTNVAFLNQVQKLQPSIGVFLSDRNHQSQVRFDHILLRATGLCFTNKHLAIEVFQFCDGEADFLRNDGDPLLRPTHFILHRL